MHIMTFSERPYYHVREDDIISNQNSYFGLANMGDTGFDPAKGHQLYHEYFDERIYAEELGFDGVMLNEHHQTPFCMGSVMDVEASLFPRVELTKVEREVRDTFLAEALDLLVQLVSRAVIEVAFQDQCVHPPPRMQRSQTCSGTCVRCECIGSVGHCCGRV